MTADGKGNYPGIDNLPNLTFIKGISEIRRVEEHHIEYENREFDINCDMESPFIHNEVISDRSSRGHLEYFGNEELKSNA
jgi:hypothetical protein